MPENMGTTRCWSWVHQLFCLNTVRAFGSLLRLILLPSLVQEMSSGVAC